MSRRKQERPGVILYFSDIRPALKRFSEHQLSSLFHAIFDYAEHGTVPELDSDVGLLFEIIQARIDQDGQNYLEVCRKNQYASFCAVEKQKGRIPISREEWEALNYDHVEPCGTTGRHVGPK